MIPCEIIFRDRIKSSCLFDYFKNMKVFVTNDGFRGYDKIRLC